jgi:hypothetical protein
LQLKIGEQVRRTEDGNRTQKDQSTLQQVFDFQIQFKPFKILVKIRINEDQRPNKIGAQYQNGLATHLLVKKLNVHRTYQTKVHEYTIQSKDQKKVSIYNSFGLGVVGNF